MGFLSKIRNRVKKQIRPNNMMIGNIRKMPRRPGMIGDMRFRGRLPQKNIAFSEAIRRLKEQIRNQQPIPERMPINRFKDPIKRNAPSFNPTIFGQPIGDMDFSQMPKISPEDMMNLQVPTDMPMTQDLPEVSPVGMMPQMRMDDMQDMEPRMMMAGGGLTSAAMAAGRNLPGRIKGLSNKIFGRNIPDRAPNFGAVPIPGRGGLTYPATALNRIRNTENAIIGGGGLGVAGVIDATQGLTEPMAMANLSIDSPEQLGKDLAGMRISIEKLIELASQKAQEIGAPITEYVDRAQRSYEDEMEAERMQQLDAEQGLKNVSLMMAGGGEADSDDFPDLSGDGETTFKDVLIGRGVDLKAEGGEMMMEETEMMAPSGDEIEASLMEVQGMQPEIQALDQFVQMVIEMVQAGASEAEVIESLRQAGLDDDDIAAVFQAVMETMQGSMEQGGIDAELAQLS